MDEQEQAELWQREGFEALRHYDYERAMELALRLKEVRHSSCFELIALIHLRQGALQSAIEILREGTEKAPGVWLLWQLLGNSLSDDNDFQGALDAYDQALRIVGNHASLQFNRALVFLRMDDRESAIEALEAAADALDEDAPLEILWRVRSTLAYAYAGERQLEAALALIPYLPEDTSELEEADESEMAQSFADFSRALLSCQDVELAEQWLHLALQFERTNTAAVRIWRKLHSREKNARTYFRVLLRGELNAGEMIDPDEETEAVGFITGIWVVANTPEEAAELAVEFEAQFWQNLPTVQEVEEPQECELQPIGVFEVQGHGFYSTEEEES